MLWRIEFPITRPWSEEHRENRIHIFCMIDGVSITRYWESFLSSLVCAQPRVRVTNLSGNLHSQVVDSRSFPVNSAIYDGEFNWINSSQSQFRRTNNESFSSIRFNAILEYPAMYNSRLLSANISVIIFFFRATASGRSIL